MPVPTQQDSTADETAGTAWPCPCVVSRSPSVGHMTVPPDKIVLLPLGMHRSGTSSLAGCLHLLGASLPKHLIPSKSDNPTGFFEPENIVMLNDEILASANSAWNDCGRFDPSLIPEGLVDKYVRRAVSMVSEEYDGARIIVLKDPRICRMLSFWFPVLGQAGYIPYVITPVRSPLEVAQSLHARNGLSLQAGMSLWLRHVIDAEFGSRSCHRFFFVWNQFLTDPNAILVELLQCFGFDLSALSPDRRQKITSFINADLRRFKAPTERLDGIPAECSVAFAALTALTALTAFTALTLILTSLATLTAVVSAGFVAVLTTVVATIVTAALTALLAALTTALLTVFRAWSAAWSCVALGLPSIRTCIRASR